MEINQYSECTTPFLIRLMMANRYIYYVLLGKVIDDLEYDTLEQEVLSRNPSDERVYDIGSSNPMIYKEDEIMLGKFLFEVNPLKENTKGSNDNI